MVAMADEAVLQRQTPDWRDAAHGIDDELDRLHQAVAAARRQRGRDADVLEPELENFLSVLAHPPSYEQVVAANPGWRQGHNSWREAMEATG